MILVGVDVGKTNGLCFYCAEQKKVLEHCGLSLYRAFKRALEYRNQYPDRELVFFVEDSRKRTWYNDKGMTKKEKRGRAMGAMANKNTVGHWEDFFIEENFRRVYVAPKNNATKQPISFFSKMKGVSLKHGDDAGFHERDAINLVYGRSVSMVNALFKSKRQKTAHF